MHENGDFPAHCRSCDERLPRGRADEYCEECRAHRMVAKRNERAKIVLIPEPAVFSDHILTAAR